MESRTPPDKPVLPVHTAEVVPPDEPTPSAKVESRSVPSTPTPPDVHAPPMPRMAPSIPRHLSDEAPVDVGPFEAFSFHAGKPLTPEELQTITLFHEQYHQRKPEEWTQGVLRQAKRDAEQVLPLLRRQLELASQTLEGAKGAEAQAIQRNIEWVEREVLPR